MSSHLNARRRCIAGLALIGAAAMAGSAAPAVRADAPGHTRAYELVSPAHKAGYPIGFSNATELSVSADGNRASYIGLFPLPGSASGALSGFLGTRDATGWNTTSWLPAPDVNQVGVAVPGADAVLRGNTPDQQAATYYDDTTAPYGSLWLVRADGTRKRIADASRVQFGAVFGEASGQPWFEGMSDDGRHVVFADSDALVPGITPSGNDILYEWVDDGGNDGAGTVHVVNRTNDVTPTLLDPSSAELGGSAGRNTSDVRNAISSDGSRIFFQNPAPTDANGVSEGGGPVYVREDGETTVEVSAPAPGHSSVTPPTLFQYLDATPDGRLVFFWANGDLTDAAPTSGGIYRYDVETGSLEFLATAEPMTTPAGTFVPTGMASVDGSRFYYQDGNDVRVYENGQVNLVLAQAPVAGGLFGGAGATPAIRDNGCVSANVSPNGKVFVFSSFIPSSSWEVYRYDEESGTTQLVSTTPTAPPSGSFDAGFAGACDGTSLKRPTRVRVMSDDGSFVFFDTSAALVPGDNNGRRDVYEWHNGSVQLVSTGTGADGATFYGTDAAGANAFFSTTQALVPSDGDDLLDLYDARVGGGFPVAAQQPACHEDACQGVPAGQFVEPTIASEATGTRAARAGARNSFRVSPISARARAKLAHTGKLQVTVHVRGDGTLVARLLARINGHWSRVDIAKRAMRHQRQATLQLSLSRRARKALRTGHKMLVEVQVRFSGVPRTRRVRFIIQDRAFRAGRAR